MPDNERKTSRGNRVQIPAQTWNALMDAARDHKRGRWKVGQTGPLTSEISPTLTVLVKNSISAFAEGYHVVRLGDPLLTAEDDPVNLAERVAFDASMPASTGAIAITAGPAALNDLVPAVVLGVTPCYVQMVEAGHEWANPAGAIHTHLVSQAEPGQARILWHGEGGTPPEGTELAMVLLTGGECCDGEEADLPFFARLTVFGGGYWSFRPLKLNTSGLYVDDADEDIGNAVQLVDNVLTPLLMSSATPTPGSRVLMRRSKDWTAEAPRYEFQAVLPTVNRCNYSVFFGYNVAWWKGPVCVAKIDLPGPGDYLIYASARGVMQLDLQSSSSPDGSSLQIHLDQSELGIGGGHFPHAVVCSLFPQTVPVSGTDYYAPTRAGGTGFFAYPYRSTDGAALRLYADIVSMSMSGGNSTLASGTVTNVAIGVLPLAGVSDNDAGCELCADEDSGSGLDPGEPTYDCVEGECVENEEGTGEYATAAECIAAGCEGEPCDTPSVTELGTASASGAWGNLTATIEGVDITEGATVMVAVAQEPWPLTGDVTVTLDVTVGGLAMTRVITRDTAVDPEGGVGEDVVPGTLTVWKRTVTEALTGVDIVATLTVSGSEFVETVRLHMIASEAVCVPGTTGEKQSKAAGFAASNPYTEPTDFPTGDPPQIAFAYAYLANPDDDGIADGDWLYGFTAGQDVGDGLRTRLREATKILDSSILLEAGLENTEPDRQWAIAVVAIK